MLSFNFFDFRYVKADTVILLDLINNIYGDIFRLIKLCFIRLFLFLEFQISRFFFYHEGVLHT